MENFEYIIIFVIRITVILVVLAAGILGFNETLNAHPYNIKDEKITFIEHSSEDQLTLTCKGKEYIIYEYDDNNALKAKKIPIDRTTIYRNLPKDKLPYLREIYYKGLPIDRYEIYLNER